MDWKTKLTIKMKKYVRQVVTGEAESHSVTLLKAGDLVDVSVEPFERGGTNEGMSPMGPPMAPPSLENQPG